MRREFLSAICTCHNIVEIEKRLRYYEAWSLQERFGEVRTGNSGRYLFSEWEARPVRAWIPNQLMVEPGCSSPLTNQLCFCLRFVATLRLL